MKMVCLLCEKFCDICVWLSEVKNVSHALFNDRNGF